ncbi:DUF2309 domain-containing protein [Thiolapillus sp.]|uniref:DUF2309 domain-containing protein n=1 Tax=Thiolapillus sp. TaxID=2017437 RepID=UPI002600DC6D|nr:DUF2309 domain-containing protein [Thiolapillus sp.]
MTRISDKALRQQIRETVHHLSHVLPGQAPIRDFVHHNTLHGYQHLPFREALAASGQATGARGYLSDEDFRQLYGEGRITRDHLLQVIDEDESLKGGERLLQPEGCADIHHRDVYLLSLTVPLDPLEPGQLDWQIGEMAALTRIQDDVDPRQRDQFLRRAADQGLHDEAAAVSDLWQACLDVLGLVHASNHPEDLLEQSLWENTTGKDDEETLHLQQLMHRDAARKLRQLLDAVGTEISLRGFIKALTGIDLMHEIRLIMIRRMAAFLDQGLAAWPTPGREKGFYAAWRDGAARDPAWIIDSIPEWQDHIDSLPDDPLDTIMAEFMRMDLPRDRWAPYLKIKAQELPGWSGMFLWRHTHPEYDSQNFPVDMLDYLAVRMVLERLLAQRVCRDIWQIEPDLTTLKGYFRPNADEFYVRHALFNAQLPEYLASAAQKLVNNSSDAVVPAQWQALACEIKSWQMRPGTTATGRDLVSGDAWRLFRLVQHLGLCGNDLRHQGTEAAMSLLQALDSLDEATRGFLWLQAYERQYRDQLFSAVAANHERGRWAERDERIRAQLVFCMDDREEGYRRNLEEVAPHLETLGAAAHFGVPHLWQGLDATQADALTPVVYEPVNLVREKPLPGQEALLAQHERRRRLRLAVSALLNQGIRRNLLTSTLLVAAAAPAALVGLAGKVLAPLKTGHLAETLKERFEHRIATHLALTAMEDKGAAPHPKQPREGFTDGEQLQRVAEFLQNLGLTDGFAPLVVFMGHGSDSENNPHLAAYDCGACSGRHSGPNARVFCAMANRAAVRQRLAQDYDIHIPDGTWFLGAEHNTCTEDIRWYDTDLLPGSHRQAFGELQASLQEAGQRHAHERCRKFASAPPDPTPEQALAHVRARRFDFSQARPELGHATNAGAFIGRRSLSQGVFFDRRVFLISYDWRNDPQGEILERLLLANGPVGAGISLEYYFSTVDNDGYGAGTKVMHNVSGLLGVMEGASSDLRTGLPRQMIEVHKAMRLQEMCEAGTGMLTRIYERQPALQELIGNGWLLLSAKDPLSGRISVFDPRKGWMPWQAGQDTLPETDCSSDWYAGHRQPLAPALVRQAFSS